jgi:glycerophosphoryl diester phosphodiesterase
MPADQFERQIWPIVVAHRGASAAAPENTLRAFDEAVAAGADVVELDVRMTIDGVAVVLHDLDVSTRTNGSGLVHQLTLAEVKRLDASGGAGSPQEVPTLEEALRRLSGRVGVDIEIKNLPSEPSFDSPREEAAAETVRLLEATVFRGPVLVSSFNWLTIERVRVLDPSVATGLICTSLLRPDEALAYAERAGHAFVLPPAASVSEAGRPFVERAHAAGVRVGTWTVDEPGETERLFEMGVDAVATNDPASAVPVRDRARERSTLRP